LKEVLFDVKVMIFMWILANFSVIALFVLNTNWRLKKNFLHFAQGCEF